MNVLVWGSVQSFDFEHKKKKKRQKWEQRKREEGGRWAQSEYIALQQKATDRKKE